MKKVFLENLPRKGKLIDWNNCIGLRVQFTYEDISGEVDIIDYNKQNGIITIKYNCKEFEMQRDNFAKCKLGMILGKITKEYKFEIRDIIGNLTIIDKKTSKREQNPDKKGRVYISTEKYYKYKCNKCGFNGNNSYYKNGELCTNGHWVIEGSLMRGSDCSCCCPNPKIVVEGINDIITTAPWMIDLGVDKEEAKRFTCQSQKKIKCICPYCGSISYKSISKIYNRKSIWCHNCGDGFSYPEKFVNNVLKQLGIEFKTQYSPIWIKGKFYDFYFNLNGEQFIIETHGGQHYKETTRGRSLQEEQENDRIKKELALNNGIEHYIELDCRESDLEWIKNSILKSKLNSICIDCVDWNKCEEYALNNLIKEVSIRWNNRKDGETTTDLGNLFGLNYSTIRNYLNLGDKLGWCRYDGREEVRKSGGVSGKMCGKKVEIFKDDISLGVFESATELERQSVELFGDKLYHRNISAVATGRQKTHKGFTFKYIKDSKEVV